MLPPRTVQRQLLGVFHPTEYNEYVPCSGNVQDGGSGRQHSSGRLTAQVSYFYTSSRTCPRMEKRRHPSHPFLSPSSTPPCTSTSSSIPIPYSSALPTYFPSTPAPLVLSTTSSAYPINLYFNPLFPATPWHPSQNLSLHHLPLFPSRSYHLDLYIGWVKKNIPHEYFANVLAMIRNFFSKFYKLIIYPYLHLN